MLAGLTFGLLDPPHAAPLAVISNIFLRLIKSVIAPVLLGVLVTAVATSGARTLGQIGWRAIVYFEIVTTLGLLLGWAVMQGAQPGRGVTLAPSAASLADIRFAQVVEQSFPTSIFDAMARGDVLQMVVFSLVLGLAAGALGAKAQAVVDFASSLAAIAFRYTTYVMYLAPFAVFAAMAVTAAAQGAGALRGLGEFVLWAWAAQLTYLVLVDGGSLLLAGAPLRKFVHCAREPFLVGFATTSSAAAIPKALEALQQFGVPQRIAGVVAPLSLSLNMGGSTIHLAMGAFFLAQAARLDLPWTSQLLILLTLKLTSKGVAGIPRANFVILAALCAQFNLPPEGLPLLLGVDAIIDMIRTAVNVAGHCVSPVVVARWARHLPE